MKTSNLVIKVASRCNLNCSYCYVYNMGDQSYKSQPKFMSQEVIESMLIKIKEHCIENNQKSFLLIFHGGEPLLTGIDFYTNFIETEKRIIPENIRIDYSMQSNGVLITEEWAKILKGLNIQVGISLDGTPNSNNKNRVYHNEKGSYNEIIRGFKIIRKVYGNQNANCLCVIDTEENPSDVYSHFKKLKANNVHFLFQDYNYIESNQNNIPKIGDWLVEMFDLWYNDTDKVKPIVRPLTDLIGLILGKNTGSEIFGKSVNETLVIETDGSIETVDTLKICGDGFTKTKFNILKDDLSLIFKESELAKLYYNSHDNICETCQSCPIESVCGGGYLGHRYSKVNGFNNPSIYCKEIIKIICHIQNEILKKIPLEIINQSGIEFLNYAEIINQFTDNYEPA
ncbi:radical SAM protein [Flavobacterium sp. ABG]|uniref:radical SAM protein n=1 Tax=Flavobacterium sp. ABG TaxID=1423322 RepID=UPI0006493CB8|nr:radical SAM protein [Flavobacterium sp. ABG]KLT71677.1 hypothetical protein AB674_01045 [Flavobacterium sp. ABG]